MATYGSAYKINRAAAAGGTMAADEYSTVTWTTNTVAGVVSTFHGPGQTIPASPWTPAGGAGSVLTYNSGVVFKNS